MKEKGIAGLSVEVMQDGKVVHARGYGHANLEHQVAATTEKMALQPFALGFGTTPYKGHKRVGHIGRIPGF